MNKKSLLADFYMYEFVCQYDKCDDELLEYELREDALEFLQDLKDELQIILEYNILFEISNVWWETDNYQFGTFNPQIAATGGDRSYVEKYLKEDSIIILQDFLDAYRKSLPDLPVDENHVLYKAERTWAYYRIIKSDLNFCTFIRDIKQLFTKLEWHTKYGGEKWEQISNAYLALLDAEDYVIDNHPNIFSVIDRIFDLQHNTSSIFHRIPSYEIDGSQEWIKEFLDFKSNLEDPWKLYKYCSQSKKMAAKKLKKLGFGTQEEKEEMQQRPKDIQDQLDRLDQNDWSLAKGVITNVVDVDATDLIKKLTDTTQKITLLQEELSQSLDGIGDNFENLGDHIQDLSDTLEVKVNDISSTLTGIEHRYTETVENMETQIKSGTVHVEKYILDTKEEILKCVARSIDSAFVQLHSEIANLIPPIPIPWYVKVINNIKKLFGK